MTENKEKQNGSSVSIQSKITKYILVIKDLSYIWNVSNYEHPDLTVTPVV